MRKYIFVLLLLTFLGCVAVNKSIDNYKACKGDPVCMSEMEKVQQLTYNAVEPVAQSSIPSIGEIIALAISNIAAFGFGVMQGRKK